MGESTFNPNSSIKFHDILDQCGVMDVGCSRPQFTWRDPIFQNYKQGFKCLDRAVCNAKWKTFFLRAFSRVLSRIKYDHHLILVTFSSNQFPHQGRRHFRYLLAWHSHAEFPCFLRDAWPNETDLPTGLFVFRDRNSKWNKNTFGSIHRRKARVLAKIRGIWKAL